ncbi:hypothetical protein COCCADRAFT_106100 [Bipolaris zeicola 26-R-13]|uniref:superoxide dismutase n=1 Tax=Cochliobolus carbonum (strain 26-R-13) TaxID=930089 RepID=W6Y3B4_COCC2|nr:uncharacterized protein COCCADRAFT_106100 [Bipolaris zeicola 26-R-13]EUC29604.1 hypothetical protein COCCADRAFT_106100 [Bipolaris zeicola 26-R-13]
MLSKLLPLLSLIRFTTAQSQVQEPAPPPALLSTAKSGVIPALPTATSFTGVDTLQGAIISPLPPAPGYLPNATGGVEGTATASPNQPSATYRAVLPDVQYNPYVNTNVTGTIDAAGDPQGVRFTVNLTNLPDQEQFGPFAWHIHALPVPSDGNCTATLGHLDPTNRGELYMCDASLPETCQVGDLAGKHGGKITSEGSFEVQFVDPYLSVEQGSEGYFGGLAFVLHTGNTTRITCANFEVVQGGNATGGVGSPTQSGLPEFTGAARKVTGGTVALALIAATNPATRILATLSAMEALLSLAFDNIASKDTQKIRKGLRQIEGMLAQICLSGTKSKPSTPGHRRNASAITLSEQQQQQQQQQATAKKLGQLSDDLAFREFFRLQEGFEWNVVTRVADCLDRLLGMGSSKDGQNDILILSSLSNIQGLLLLHPPSRIIFGREVYMNLLLDLLDPYNCPAIQSQALLVLVSALLATPQNTRIFEHMDGLLTVTSLFKDEETTQGVKVKLLEFLYFYLMPEMPVSGPQRSRDKVRTAMDRRGSTDDGSNGIRKHTRSQAEKQHMLGKYLNNVDALVEDLQESAPFTNVSC